LLIWGVAGVVAPQVITVNGAQISDK
jgi:hypothetical protein